MARPSSSDRGPSSTLTAEPSKYFSLAHDDGGGRPTFVLTGLSNSSTQRPGASGSGATSTTGATSEDFGFSQVTRVPAAVILHAITQAAQAS